ncbi:MAG: adenylate/guanylate cyclase domain-containing protein [Anaerolineales bacterium]
MSENKYPEERRLATVLFADVQGFTALAEKLDFETVSDLIKGIWKSLDKVIESHGGYIDKHLGDGIMAVWGAPFASDNDAEQAIVAGMEMVKALDDFCLTSNIPGAELLKLRVGINSGAVFAGYIGSRDEYTVLGDTVNVAARLEQIAAPGTVVIGENTFRMVRSSFRVRRLEPTLIKGKAEMVQPYTIEGYLNGAGRPRYQSAESLVTNMVAREVELKRLDKLFKHTVETRHPQMALIHGEVGIGKSRLMLEFNNHLQENVENVHIFSTRALAQTSRIPYYLWRVMLRNHFGMQDDDKVDDTAQKWQSGLGNLWQNEPDSAKSEATLILGEIIGVSAENIPESNEKQHRIFFLIADMLYRIGQKNPLVLFVDDLQWADRESLQLLSFLLSLNEPKMALMVVGAARPELLKSQPQWHNLARSIQLEPIAFDAELVSLAYPDLQGLPNEALEAIAGKAEGNPYFMEEIVKSLVKSGALQNVVSAEQIQKELIAKIPESLSATLQARLDNLTREARAVIMMASVVGRIFWVGSVIAQTKSGALPGGLPIHNAPQAVIERFIQDGLRQLVRAELAFPRENSQFSEEQEYIFKNAFLRDVAYSLIPNRNRAELHQIVADWLDQHTDRAYKGMAEVHKKSAEYSRKLSTGNLPPIQAAEGQQLAS